MAAKSAGLGIGHASSSIHKNIPDRREPSGAFTMFTPQQVKQFKEAFNMIDQDGDGRVTESDLKTMLSELGQTPTPSLLNSLLSSRSDTQSGVNFTQFLSMMGEKLLELDPEQEILDAFACFDEGDKGVVQVAEMRKWLGELGDRMEDWEIERLFSGQFADRQGRFNYIEFAQVLRVNDGEPEREDKLTL